MDRYERSSIVEIFAQDVLNVDALEDDLRDAIFEDEALVHLAVSKRHLEYVHRTLRKDLEDGWQWPIYQQAVDATESLAKYRLLQVETRYGRGRLAIAEVPLARDADGSFVPAEGEDSEIEEGEIYRIPDTDLPAKAAGGDRR